MFLHLLLEKEYVPKLDLTNKLHLQFAWHNLRPSNRVLQNHKQLQNLIDPHLHPNLPSNQIHHLALLRDDNFLCLLY